MIIRQGAIDSTYKAWQAIDTILIVVSSHGETTVFDAFDTEVQNESLRLFEQGLLFPINPAKANVFSDLDVLSPI